MHGDTAAHCDGRDDKLAFVQDICTVLPDHLLAQDKVREMGKRILKGKVPFLNQALNLFLNAGVEKRHLVRDVHEILDNDDLGWRNQVFCEMSIILGTQAMEELFAKNDLQPDEIDLLITTSCTGFMIPSVDAFLINHFKMRQDTKRLPITELGCAAGAMALSRAREYLAAFPDHKVVILALELPSLTYQTKDFRMANLVSAALFGDGGAAVLLGGHSGKVKVLANQTHFFYDQLSLMGFELNQAGFKIILDKGIPELIDRGFDQLLDSFLQSHQVSRSMINHWVFHPGGRRIMDSLRDVLELQEEDIAASREVLKQVGNLSSASVFWVLAETLKKKPQGLGFMTAFGPGFNAELLLLDF